MTARFSRRLTGTSSGNCQETETSMVWACLAPRQPLQNHPSGHLGGWATPWSAKEMLDGQRKRVAIPAHARTAHNGLMQKKMEEDLCWIAPHVPPTTQSVEELNWTDLSCLGRKTWKLGKGVHRQFKEGRKVEFITEVKHVNWHYSDVSDCWFWCLCFVVADAVFVVALFVGFGLLFLLLLLLLLVFCCCCRLFCCYCSVWRNFHPFYVVVSIILIVFFLN